MRKRNWRLIVTGVILILGAGAFLFEMRGLASRSHDPVEMMKTVGQVSGVAVAIGLFLLALGMVGKRF
jgi:hypothetical protein